MLSTKSNKIKLLLCSFITVNLFAQDNLLEKNILSESRQKSIELNKKKALEDASKLRKDWINPITYTYTKNLGESYENEKSVISVNQPIFKSGGIYQAIKFANNSYKYSTLEINQQQKDLVKTAINYLFLIEKTNLNIQKANLSLANAKIDVNRKKEQVLNGFLDSSFLDNALLTLNNTKHNLVDLKYSKQELINNFHNISSKDYTSFELPEFKMFNKKEFLESNIELKKAKVDIEKKENYSYMTLAKYLPTVKAFYTYTDHHHTDGNASLTKGDSKSYGLTVSIPFDTKTFNDVESKKIEYLQSKLNLINKTSDEETFYKTKLDKINMLDERISITNEDLKIYKSILDVIYEEKKAQLKTQSDIDTLANSKNIKVLDLKIYKLDKQIELLDLYSKLQ